MPGAEASNAVALITGVAGQDGWYLAEQLQAEGTEVFGLVLADDASGVPPGVTPPIGDLRDETSIRDALRECAADVVFNLAAISSVAASWRDPVPVGDVAALGVGRLLSAIRDSEKPVKIVNASSAEIFGDAPAPQDEETPIAPTNPYGAAKAYAHHLITSFRAQGVWAASAILFPHESPRRPSSFVSRKITRGVALIATGSTEPLVLGNLEAQRDWGFAGDYMRALRLIAGLEQPHDFVVATGRSHSIRDFVAEAFAAAGISAWEAHVTQSAEFARPTDAAELRGDAGRLRTFTGWRPETDFESLVRIMVTADVASAHEAQVS